MCQNQSIDDSDAELARDLRMIVREHISAGETDAQIQGYLVDRYGDFVLLKPPFKPATWGLWLGPLGLLLAAGGGAWGFYRRRARGGEAEAAPLSAAERKRLDSLMKDES